MSDAPRASVSENLPASSLEFLGLPGSGKTTLYKLMLRELDARNVPYRLIERDAAKLLAPKTRGLLTKLFRGLAARELKRPPDSISSAKYKAYAEFVRDHPGFVRFALESEQTRIKPGNSSELLLMGWVLEQMWSYQAVYKDNRVRNALMVRDHSFCQLSVSLFPYRDLSEIELDSQIADYFAVVPAPRYLVLVRSDRAGVEERLAIREFAGRMRRLAPEVRKAVLDKAERCVAAGAEQLRRRGVTVFEVNNDGPRSVLEEAARDIVGKIAAHRSAITAGQSPLEATFPSGPASHRT
jgi:hypothetical protein